MFKKKNKKIYIWIMWSVLFGIFIKIEKNCRKLFRL